MSKKSGDVVCAVFCTVKNEGPYILEWVAWCRLVGFDRIFIAQNDSDDGTIELLECLHQFGVITYLDNSFERPQGGPPPSHQARAYRLFLEMAKSERIDWAMAIDIDEFVFVHSDGENIAQIKGLIDDDLEELRLNWRFLSDADERRFVDALVTTRFRYTKPLGNIAKFPTPVKTLFSVDNALHLGPHFPSEYASEPKDIRNGSGLSVQSRERVSITDPDACRFGYVAHYRTKDLESFLMKAKRGIPNVNAKEVYDRDYWQIANTANVYIEDLASQSASIGEEIRNLDEICDGSAKPLHDASVKRWKSSIKGLWQNPDYLAIARRIDPTFDPTQQSF
jgi:hypothetical protein